MSATPRQPKVNAPDPWQAVSAARLPAAFLGALAPLRDRADVRVDVAGESAWVRWPAGRSEVVRRLLGVPGVEFFARRGRAWSRFGSRLPASEAPLYCLLIEAEWRQWSGGRPAEVLRRLRDEQGAELVLARVWPAPGGPP